jgi:hypothetical protein
VSGHIQHTQLVNRVRHSPSLPASLPTLDHSVCRHNYFHWHFCRYTDLTERARKIASADRCMGRAA